MSDNPELVAFIASIEAMLRDKVLPSATGDARFAGLMAASAIGMVQREIGLKVALFDAAQDIAALAPQPLPFDDPAEALVHLIRVGLMDGQDELHLRLMIHSILRTAVTRPQILSENERRIAGLH